MRTYKRKAGALKGELTDIKRDMVADDCAISTEGAGRVKPRLSVMLEKLSDS